METHYELLPEPQEKRRIGDWLSVYSENVKGRYVHNRAKSSNVTEVMNWVVARKGVDVSEVNPDGLNCANGVVKINPDGSHVLIPHSPDRIYTYVGCKYDPDADPTDCDRLLECLTPAYREVFLSTAAAAFAVKLVRKKIGRKLRGLLCYGDGSNGKDTLRTALAEVLGRGMTGKSLLDFKEYDRGRKFNLVGIERSLCNWASENTSAVKLDSLQSLKQFITGDPLDIEPKGKDSYPCNPSAIGLFNCNKLPSITGGMEAITSRYSIIKFEKTFVVGADPSRGELEADPRFKDDPDFVREKIAPALLNKLLAILPKVLTEGIDHSVTREAMEEAQEESRHLWGFVREIGVEADPAGKIYIGDLYPLLERWYVENGWLVIEDAGGKNKKSWEAESPYDPPVKKAQDLYLRLKELFPKIERRIDTQEQKNRRFISGLKLEIHVNHVNSTAQQGFHVIPGINQNQGEKVHVNHVDSPSQQGFHVIPTPVGEHGEHESAVISQICTLLKSLSAEGRQKLAEILTQPQPKPEQPATPAEVKSDRPASDTVQNQPPLAPEPATETKRKNFKVGDRVEIVGSDIKHYNGVTGTVIDVWAKTNSWGCTVDFDTPIGNANFCDFPAYELRKLHDSDG